MNNLYSPAKAYLKLRDKRDKLQEEWDKIKKEEDQAKFIFSKIKEVFEEGSEIPNYLFRSMPKGFYLDTSHHYERWTQYTIIDSKFLHVPQYKWLVLLRSDCGIGEILNRIKKIMNEIDLNAEFVSIEGGILND